MKDKRPPEELTPEELRARIVANAVRIRNECDEVIAICEYWARHRPECEPIDFEWFRLQRANAVSILRQLGEIP